jgi:hypothetical protein
MDVCCEVDVDEGVVGVEYGVVFEGVDGVEDVAGFDVGDGFIVEGLPSGGDVCVGKLEDGCVFVTVQPAKIITIKTDKRIASTMCLICFFPIFDSPTSVYFQVYLGLFVSAKLAGAVVWPAFSGTLPTPNMKSVFGIAGIVTGVENR